MNIKMKRQTAYLGSFFLFLFSMSCATIFQGGPDKVSVSTTPDGARVYLDGHHVGSTPTTLTVDRASEGVLEVKMDGYETITMDMDKVATGTVFLDILWGYGAPVALAIDLLTHNQGKYSTDPIIIKLVKK